jgi:hypothetical protein
VIRTILFLVVLAAAAIIPILLSNGGAESGPGSVTADLAGSLADATSGSSIDSATMGTASGGDAKSVDHELYALLQPVNRFDATATRITPIADILRFDVSPSDVAQRWPRISTHLPVLELRGMRAPFITGTSPHDVHGVITYYFDRNLRLQRIVLHGYTGDAGPVIQFVQTMYRLQEYASVGERIFVSHQNGHPLSLMRIRNAPVMAADRPYAQHELNLELNAPEKDARLSDESLGTLRRMRDANLL